MLNTGKVGIGLMIVIEIKSITYPVTIFIKQCKGLGVIQANFSLVNIHVKVK